MPTSHNDNTYHTPMLSCHSHNLKINILFIFLFHCPDVFCTSTNYQPPSNALPSSHCCSPASLAFSPLPQLLSSVRSPHAHKYLASTSTSSFRSTSLSFSLLATLPNLHCSTSPSNTSCSHPLHNAALSLPARLTARFAQAQATVAAIPGLRSPGLE